MTEREGTRAALGVIVPMTLGVAVLTMFGMVSVKAWSEDEGTKQLIFMMFGLAAALGAQMVNYRTLLMFSPVLFGLSLLPVLYTIAGRFTSVPFVRQINGAYAWINFGTISFQPAEVTKVCLMLLLAWTLQGENAARSLWVLARTLVLGGVAIGLILMQPDLGTVLTLLAPMMVMSFVAGVRKRHLWGLVGLVALAAPVLWFSGHCAQAGCDLCPNVPGLNRLPQFVKHYHRARVEAMFSSDPRIVQGAGYQQQRALEALGSGGLRGKGAGNIEVGQRVPEAHTDMVLALIGEQFGLLGIAIVILAYLLVYGSGAAIASEHREQGGKLLAIGLVTLLAGQTIMNMAVAMRLMPVTGLTLPFVSYGGSSLVASYLAFGLLVNVARNQRRVRF